MTTSQSTVRLGSAQHPMNSARATDTLRSLETLRIIAAVLVVTAHLPPTNIPVLKWFVGDGLFLGSIGVDLFFVISGVVIGLSVLRAVDAAPTKSTFTTFVVSRVFRIYPL